MEIDQLELQEHFLFVSSKSKTEYIESIPEEYRYDLLYAWYRKNPSAFALARAICPMCMDYDFKSILTCKNIFCPLHNHREYQSSDEDTKLSEELNESGKSRRWQKKAPK